MHGSQAEAGGEQTPFARAVEAVRGGASVDTVTTSVPVSLQPLALWSDDAQGRVPAASEDVGVQVGAHAQDPHALAVELSAARDAP